MIFLPIPGGPDLELSPDRQNIMSYFGCPPQHLSDQQAARALAALRTGNRRHLVGL